MSAFMGIEIGSRGLRSQQLALEVTQHNVANANTPGFSRQAAPMGTTTPLTISTASYMRQQQGTGVSVESIHRVRDSFLDRQYRSEVQELERWTTSHHYLKQLEGILHEPGEAGLRGVMDDFWSSWQELSKEPDNVTVRAIVVEEGKSLLDALQHMERQWEQLRDDINQHMSISLGEINQAASQIAYLNQQILRVEVSSQKANDLRDQRDRLLDELAEKAVIQVRENEWGVVDVVMGDRGLVEGVRHLTLRTEGTPGDPDWRPVWEDGRELLVRGGELQGLLEARDNLVRMQGDFQDYVAHLVGEVNRLHRAGFDLNASPGLDFFNALGRDQLDGDDLEAIRRGDIPFRELQVNPVVAEDPERVAAAEDPDELPGEGEMARRIGALREESMPGGRATFTERYNAIVGETGIRVREAQRMADNQKAVTDQVDRRREQVSGVSLDEEVTDMLRFQHAYNASSRLITAVDEMLDKLINGTGVVGR